MEIDKSFNFLKQENDINEIIEDPNVLNIYHFGSYVYDTCDDHSDFDYIVIVKELPSFGNKLVSNDGSINLNILNVQQFENQLYSHDISALECISLKKDFVVKESIKFNFVLNKEALRKSISMITENSWQKAKKKLIVVGDYDKRIALKSAYHAIRIRAFAIQIAQYGYIYDFKEYNYVIKDLLSLKGDYVELWDLVSSKYLETFNSLGKHFRELCPIIKNKGVSYNKKELIILVDSQSFEFTNQKDFENCEKIIKTLLSK